MINPSYGEEREREKGGVVQIIARLRLNLPSVYIGGRSDTERERERRELTTMQPSPLVNFQVTTNLVGDVSCLMSRLSVAISAYLYVGDADNLGRGIE